MQLKLSSELKQRGGKGDGDADNAAAGSLSDELFTALTKNAELEEALDKALAENEVLQAELLELYDKKEKLKKLAQVDCIQVPWYFLMQFW